MGTTAIQKVTYEAGGQHIELTPATVKQYLVLRRCEKCYRSRSWNVFKAM